MVLCNYPCSLCGIPRSQGLTEIFEFGFIMSVRKILILLIVLFMFGAVCWSVSETPSACRLGRHISAFTFRDEHFRLLPR